MAFGQGRSGGGGRGRGGDKKPGDKAKGQRRTLFRRRKVCKFCADKIDDINYKDVKLLGPFVPERGKILPRRISGTCAMHQRKLQVAIKRARQIAQYPWFAHKKPWQKELDLMLKNGFKLEVEALISKDISYVTEEYVPARLAEGNFLD